MKRLERRSLLGKIRTGEKLFRPRRRRASVPVSDFGSGTRVGLRFDLEEVGEEGEESFGWKLHFGLLGVLLDLV